MIYAIAALGVVCILLVVVIFGLLRFMRDRFSASDRAVQTMADRVQAPDRLPVRDDDRVFVAPEREPDEWNKVGDVVISDNWLAGDED